MGCALEVELAGHLVDWVWEMGQGKENSKVILGDIWWHKSQGGWHEGKSAWGLGRKGSPKLHVLHLRSLSPKKGSSREAVGCAVPQLKRMFRNKDTGDSIKNEITNIEARLQRTERGQGLRMVPQSTGQQEAMAREEAK